MSSLGLVVSGSHSEDIRKAVNKIQTFLDSVGARYRFHDSHKSDSAYFQVKEPPAVADDPWDPDVVDTRVSDHSLPERYDQPDLDVSVPRPRPKAVSPDYAIKLLKDFFKGKVDIEDGEVIPVTSDVGGVNMYGVSENREPGILVDFANLLNATQSDFHFLHFYAGAEGFWDRIHDICGDYYFRLANDYDDIAELCLQLDMDITHPNNSASVIGFENSAGSLENCFSFDSAMQIIQNRLHNILDLAVTALLQFQGDNVSETAVRNYLEGFIQEWSKEVDYKTKQRLGGVEDFGGSYRDTAGEMITGDVDENGFDNIMSAYDDEDVTDEDGPFTLIAKGFNSSAEFKASFDTFSEASKYLRDHSNRFDYAEVVDRRGNPLLFENLMVASSKKFYPSLFFPGGHAIFSTAELQFSNMSDGVVGWLRSLNVSLVNVFPGGQARYAESSGAWQFVDVDGRIKFSFGVDDDGSYNFLCDVDGEYKGGKSKDLAEVNTFLHSVFGGRNER
jgi:hypothetical protein